MTREEITRDLAARYNKGQGTVQDLSTEYGADYNQYKFYRDIKKYGIIKDTDTDKFIIPGKVMSGQIDILSTTVEPQSLEESQTTNTMASIDTEQQGVKVMPENTPKEELEVVKVNKEPRERKKKTFEIDTDLEQLIRVQAAILDITINDYVNEVLRKSISDNVKSIIK